MSNFNYQSIVDYFRSVAERESTIAHGVGGRKSFTKSDVSDALASQNTFLDNPYVIVGYEPEGLDRGAGSYSFSDSAKANRVYSINVAIFKENKINTHDGTYDTLQALDELADAWLAIMEGDRTTAFDGSDRDLICFHQSMNLDVPIYKTARIGNQQALGIIMNFTWEFCR